MSEKSAFRLTCEKELDRLKKEEAFIREILRLVQKQLGKYRVEDLHMTHVTLDSDDEGDTKLDEDELSNDKLMDSEMLDTCEIINRNKLDLDIKLQGNENDEEYDESDDSDLAD